MYFVDEAASLAYVRMARDSEPIRISLRKTDKLWLRLIDGEELKFQNDSNISMSSACKRLSSYAFAGDNWK